jgi:uncharacterized protein
MNSIEMPMFPLGTVLLPGSLLPLHVFEPRYRRMMDECLIGTQEFGVVLITRGREVGGGDERSSAATVARILQHHELDDGRRAVMTAGVRRVRVDEWLADDPYPRAMVTDWPDDDPDVSPERIEEVYRQVRRTLVLAVELGEATADPESEPEIADDPFFASFHLGAMAPLGPYDQAKLLSIAGAGARLDALEEMLVDVDAGLRFRLGLPPDSNG